MDNVHPLPPAGEQASAEPTRPVSPSEATPQPPAAPANAPLDPASMQRVLQELLQNYTDARDRRTVQEVLDAYLSQAAEEITPRTLEMRVRTLKLFGQQFGTLPANQCTPLQLKEWVRNQSQWSSGYSKMRVHADVQRAFNWAAGMRLIRENPFKGLRLAPRAERRTGRDMHPEEFQALLRASDPAFRRLLVALKMTGARPGELSALRWRHVDWEKGVAILEQHKTRRKTGKPRILVFPPPIMKLLVWLFRHRHGSAAVELQRILQAAPDRRLGVREVAKQMMAKGFNYRQIYGARRLIGATFERVGGWGAKGRTVYTLPAHPVEHPEKYADFVFLCSKKRPWQRTALGCKFKRLRKALGLPLACKLYGLRHSFITDGIKRNVNLMTLAKLVGHSDTRMIASNYCHVGDDFPYLQAAALQALGQSALATPIAPQPPANPTAEAPAPAEPTAEGQAPTEPKTVAETGSTEELVRLLIRRIQTLEAERKAAQNTKPPREQTLQPAHHLAYQLARMALRQEPALRQGTDQAIYEWLHARPEYRDQLPPTAVSFIRYLRQARKLIDHSGKYEQKRNPPVCDPNPNPEKGGA